MLYHNGNTLGNNGLHTAGQVEQARTLTKGDRVRYTEAHKLTLRDHKLHLSTDDDCGTVAEGGLPNAVFVVGWDRGTRTMVHSTFLERVPEDQDPSSKRDGWS
jgi:hypothetical protein